MDELKSILESSPTASPVHPDPRAHNMGLKIHKNITYIVAAVVIQDGKVLLTQEAFHPCRGMWYLPAGKMEPNETIAEATKREVREETGLEFEPESIFYVEVHHQWRWIRFTLAGHIIGGSLRTLDQADSETMQANWWPANIEKLQKEVPLRARDMLSLINAGRQWYEKKPFHSMPVDIPHVSSSLRLVLVNCGESGKKKKKKETGGEEVSVLMSSGAGCSTSLPVAVGGSQFDPIGETLKACGYKGEFKICGVLGVEHFGKKSDGFCITVLLQALSTELGKTGKGSPYQWSAVTDAPTAHSLQTAVFSDFGCSWFD